MVGAGYVGLEMAEALHARRVAVTVVEAMPAVMPTLDESIATLVAEEVRRHGVDLRLGARFNGGTRDEDQLLALVDGEERGRREEAGGDAAEGADDAEEQRDAAEAAEVVADVGGGRAHSPPPPALACRSHSLCMSAVTSPLGKCWLSCRART